MALMALTISRCIIYRACQRHPQGPSFFQKYLPFPCASLWECGSIPYSTPPRLLVTYLADDARKHPPESQMLEEAHHGASSFPGYAPRAGLLPLLPIRHLWALGLQPLMPLRPRPPGQSPLRSLLRLLLLLLNPHWLPGPSLLRLCHWLLIS